MSCDHLIDTKTVSFPPTRTKSFTLPVVFQGGCQLEPEGGEEFLQKGRPGKHAERCRGRGSLGRLEDAESPVFLEHVGPDRGARGG